MAENVPAEHAKFGFLARAPQRLFGLGLLKHAPVVCAEHERPAKVLLLLERGERVIAQWDIAPLGSTSIASEPHR